MTLRFQPLALAATHARPVLVAGLAAGLALPGLAAVLSGWIPEMVVGLLFLGALRLSPGETRLLGRGLPATLFRLLVLQLGLPLTILGIAAILGQAASPLVLALVLVAAAPPIVSSPNLAVIMGLSQPSAMQHMMLGSIILPLTALPVFWLMPALGSAEVILSAVGRLVLAIALAGGGAILLRRLVLPDPSPDHLRRLDGVSVIALAIFVIALMPAVSRSVLEAPTVFGFWLVTVFAANFGAQLVALRWLPRSMPGRERGAIAMMAGNRNLALFFVALPPEITAPLLVFLGCYQLPMLLTPILLARVYRQID